MTHDENIPALRRPSILVIDDSMDVHRLLRARLRGEALDIEGKLSGDEGIAAVKEMRPSLVLLDLDMPGTDGFEVIRILKDDPETLHIPVIVLSGLQSPHDKVTAIDLDAIDYITKPFDVTELKVRIRSALRIHQLLDMLSQKAQIDGLTGLFNRAHFDARWPQEIAGSQRHARPLSLAILDIDHFKSINDTYGHPAGDAALAEFSTLIQQACRETDIACRYGGEEFALIMPDTGPDAAHSVCERVRTALQAKVWPRHPERTVTCSIGLAGCDGAAGVEAAPWIEAADKNLYAAKRDGRNRTISSAIAARSPRLAEAS